ncbi:MAG: hypothetical protein M0R51_03070 [Clostridia bacterium]|jgi:hypothetical protein|nr:hypothetical protein [Clostridia bacterium]
MLKVNVQNKTVNVIGEFSIMWNCLEKEKFGKFFTDNKIKKFVADFTNYPTNECKNLVKYFIKFCNKNKRYEEIETYNSLSNKDQLNFINENNFVALKKMFPQTKDIKEEKVKGYIDNQNNLTVKESEHHLDDDNNINLKNAFIYLYNKYISSKGSPDRINEKEILTFAIIIIYRIRNNMFHGEKEIFDIDYQYDLFERVNAVLSKILDIELKITLNRITSV